MDEIFNKMKSGSAAVSSYYAGDFLSMHEENSDLEFFYPREGTNSYVDAMCIPANSRNADLAHHYINFMCSEEIAVLNAEYTYYASPVTSVIENEDYRAYMEEVHEDAMEILYGTSDIPLEAYRNLSPEMLSLVNSLWEDLKIESSISTSIIVLASAILAALIGTGVFFFVRSRKRRRALASLWK
jgi:spermidine/putrescine transport system substrate-binding protein